MLLCCFLRNQLAGLAAPWLGRAVMASLIDDLGIRISAKLFHRQIRVQVVIDRFICACFRIEQNYAFQRTFRHLYLFPPCGFVSG